MKFKKVISAWFLERKTLDPQSQFANFGCGSTFHEQFDNFDFMPCSKRVRNIDLRKSLPLPDESYTAVYSSHTLEHLPRNEVPIVLKEFYRILRSGGVLRVVVPDLELTVRTYLQELERAAAGDEEGLVNHEWMSIEIIDQMTRTFRGGFMGRKWRSRPLAARDFIEGRLGCEAEAFLAAVDADVSKFGPPISAGDVFHVESPSPEDELDYRAKGEIHRWMYDRISLRKLLEEARFVDALVCRAEESAIPSFSSFCLDVDENGRIRKPESLFMEARKPGPNC